MAEEKILIPTYKRSGECSVCGAPVYAPDVRQGSGWPLMSVCTCKRGPKIARANRAENQKLDSETRPESQAQAA